MCRQPPTQPPAQPPAQPPTQPPAQPPAQPLAQPLAQPPAQPLAVLRSRKLAGSCSAVKLQRTALGECLLPKTSLVTAQQHIPPRLEEYSIY